MDSFYADLKKARETNNISLNDISDATLINVKMLEALERGEVHVLPQPYVRAFIREYAAIVGLNQAAIMQKYDAWLDQEALAGRKVPQEAVKAPSHQTSTDGTRKTFSDRFEQVAPTVFKIVAAIAVLVLIDIVLWNLLEREPARPVKETSFKDVVREHEEKAGITDQGAKPGDGSPVPAEGQTKPAAGVPPLSGAMDDSLTLVASTTDSVWMQIIIDDNILSEYLLSPHSTLSWKAKNNFRIPAIGNPTAIAFTLNGTAVSFPAKRGLVTRDLEYTRASLPAH